MTRLPATLTAILAVELLIVPVPALAQPANSVYIGATLGAHLVDADAVEGAIGSVGVAAGLRLSQRWGVEVEGMRPTGTLFREYTGYGTSFAGPGASLEEIERLGVFERFSYERRVLSTFSGCVVFRPSSRGRWSPRFVAGVTNHQVRERRLIEPLRLPAGVDPERLESVRAQEERHTRAVGGLTFGGSLAFALTPHVAIAPDVRYDYGSIGDEIENTLRPSVRILWFF